MYLSECLRMISRNTARREGDEYMGSRFNDIIKKKQQKESGEEIAARIIGAITGEAVSI